MDYTAFHEHGFQVARGIVPRAEVPALLREADLLNAAIHSGAPLDLPLRALWTKSADGKSILRGLHNAHCISPVMDGLRLHPAIGRILADLLGQDITTVVTALFWKPPGERATGVAYHRDAGFRVPPESYRNLARSYVQLAVALDPQDEANGCLHFVPGSHRDARGPGRPAAPVLEGDADAAELEAYGLPEDAAGPVALEPGDVVFWGAYMLHGSPPNRTRDRDRRSFSIASMRSADCDVGTLAYVGGKAFPVQNT